MTATSFTVGRLARRFGFSRSTLLYYDSIGLLRASSRSSSKYRLYSNEDAARLAFVCRYRSAGVSLGDIRRILDRQGDDVTAVLDRRLAQLDEEIAKLRAQQDVIVQILKGTSLRRRRRRLDKDQWVALLRAAGLDDEGMHRWHREFERLAPDAHQEFLESLHIAERDIRRIRTWAADGAQGRRRKRRLSVPTKAAGLS